MGFIEFPITPLCRRLLIAISVLQAIIWAIVILRLYSRLIQKTRALWEDISVVLTIITTTVMLVLFAFSVTSGFGHPDPEIYVNYSFNGKLAFIQAWLYGVGIICARFTVFLFYLRAFPNRPMQLATKFLMVISTCLVVAFALWSTFLCRPVRRAWDITAGGTCGDIGGPYRAITILSIGTDIIAISLPLPLIWRLNTRRQNKINLTCLFVVGLSTPAIASWRLASLSIVNSETRATFLFTAILEIGLVVVCSSVPIIYPLFLSRYQKLSSGHSPNAQKGEGRVARVIRTIGSISLRRRSYNHLDSGLDISLTGLESGTLNTNKSRSLSSSTEAVQGWPVTNSQLDDEQRI
ncbi:hypothetical protein F4805DRAFT_436377 [Annulohypoxylon moriforme]|nr:hypothetical protein F4805DRAFT_436377 [Annulohypoxylon moriforme]